MLMQADSAAMLLLEQLTTPSIDTRRTIVYNLLHGYSEIGQLFILADVKVSLEDMKQSGPASRFPMIGVSIMAIDSYIKELHENNS